MNYKDICQAYLKEIKAESAATRKCLERIPASTYKFKPHEKSMEMGYLTLLTAEIPNWVATMIKETVIDFATFPHFELGDAAALLQHYDENVQKALEALENATEEQVSKDFELRNSGQLLFKAGMLDYIGPTINHWVHHRGQLTVYMRLNDIAVPSIYGPSADEPNF